MELEEAQGSSYMVVVDLRELDFIDCAGLGLLVAAEAQARRTKRSLVLIRGGGRVGRMLELTGLLEALEVVDLRASGRVRPVLGTPDTRHRGTLAQEDFRPASEQAA